MNGLRPSFWIAIAFFVVIAAIAIWDTYAMFAPDRLKTVSSYALNWSLESPVLPFIVGVVVGHLFFPQFTPAK